MPIQIELPDGSIAEFPDGMSDAEIERVLRAQFGGQENKPDFSNVTGGADSVAATPQRGNAVTRALGEVGGRQVLQGAAGLYGALGGDALNHYVLDPVSRATGLQLGTGGRTYRQAAADAADSMGMRAPQTSGERIASDVGEALTGTGLTLGIGGGANAVSRLGGGAATRVGNLLTAQPKLQAVSAATGSGAASWVREGGGSEGQQITAGLLAGLAPGVASATSGAAVRGLVRGRDGTQMQRTIEDFAALGATPSVGQASGNQALQGVESLLAGGPTSAGVMNRFASQQADDIGAGLANQARNLSRKASAESAGRSIERGVSAFQKAGRAKQAALYAELDNLIPDATPTGVKNTLGKLSELTTPTPGASATTGALVHPKIAQLQANLSADVAANGGNIPYSALREIRSQVGEQISDYSMTPDAPTRQLRQLYRALSQDLDEVAKAQGSQAANAAKRANTYTRTFNDRLEDVQRVIDKNGGPEAVYNATMSGTKDGGTTLRKVMQSLPPEGQRAVTAATIRRMGMPTPGQAGMDAAEEFSAATFLTNWNRVSPEAKRALFDRHGLGFSKDMDRIARVANNIKQGSKVFANPSGSANKAAAYTYGASLVASMFDLSGISTAGLVGSGVGANYLARKMTDPDVVRWLASSTKVPIGSATAQIQTLRKIGERKGDPEILELADTLEREHP